MRDRWLLLFFIYVYFLLLRLSADIFSWRKLFIKLNEVLMNHLRNIYRDSVKSYSYSFDFFFSDPFFNNVFQKKLPKFW